MTFRNQIAQQSFSKDLSVLEKRSTNLSFLLLLIVLPRLLSAGDWDVREPQTPLSEFGLTIRSTPFRSPQEELAGFHVPQGFEVDLVASEPTILKPLNLAFDDRGRLWVSQTKLYPFPAKDGEEASDSIVVLEDKNRDGTLESSTTFADALNIPMGLLPTRDGIICFSIPNILSLRDRDGDGHCDERTVLYGPFDTTRDTHGMVNSLRDGGDGWIYACHGFNNQSVVKGRDGHEVSLTSGNVFRFRPDGSRIELFTQGQVNPFGMARDPYGNWFSADCHSKPISQLIRGGCYPSFGRPDDGLGFVPPMMEHAHGSTAIAGLAHTSNSRFPQSMKDQLVSGNVMTCRINRNQLVYQGATAKAIECTDLLTSEDSWFRPVDLTFGPDGHLYVADFYNGIIGHYEVPLNHPGRDRTSGRIWRIRWTGPSPIEPKPFTTLEESNHSVESLDRLPIQETKAAFQWLRGVESLSESPNVDVLRWMLSQPARIARCNDPILSQGYLISLRRLIQRSVTSQPSQTIGIVETMGREGDIDCRATLVKVLPALKDSRFTKILLTLLKAQLDKQTENEEVSRTLDSLAGSIDEDNMTDYLNVLRQLASGSESQIQSQIAERFTQLLRKQKEQKGALSATLKAHASDVFQHMTTNLLNNRNSTIPMQSWLGINANEERQAWPIQTRTYDDGSQSKQEIQVFSSFPLGEAYVGNWSTSPFVAPPRLSFALCGHNGLPSQPDTQKNFVRLLTIDLVTGEKQEIHRAYPPRNDVAKKVNWDLSPVQGQMVILEIVDHDKGDSYAWIALGGLEPAALGSAQERKSVDQLLTMASLIGTKNLPTHAVERLLGLNSPLDFLAKFQLKKSDLLAIAPLHTVLMEIAMEHQHWDLIAGQNSESLHNVALDDQWLKKISETIPIVLKRLPANVQSRSIVRLSQFRESPSRFADWISSGLIGPDALRSLPSSWWETLTEQNAERLLPIRDQLHRLVDRSADVKDKLVTIRAVKGNLELGKRVYADKCSLCHKLGATGNVLGPQLEGIGNRGEERLCEDILWPDRNVDEAFRVTLFLLEDDTTVSGLLLERTDQTVLVAEQNGQKRTIPIKEIVQERRSEVSLMPGNLGDTLTPEELSSLLVFLQQAAKKQ